MEGIWVFGGTERDSNPPKCFFVPAEDHSAATLIPIIKQWIKTGTTVLSGCWKTYHSLNAEGYIHSTVNHSTEFVTDKGLHTNNIESHWNAVKKSLPRYGTTKTLYSSYFAEYCIRRKFLDNVQDKFVETLRLISMVYNPNRDLHLQPLPAPEPQPQPPIPVSVCQELLSSPEDNTADAVVASTQDIVIRPIDEANFDLNFSISECTDSQDSCDDMFL